MVEKKRSYVRKIIDKMKHFVRYASLNGKRFSIPVICVFLSLLPQIGRSTDFKSFYYKDSKILEKRMVSYLRGEYEGILINYPVSDKQDEQELEQELLQIYGRDAGKAKIAQDVKKGITENKYYEVYMISESIYKKEDIISFISTATDLVKDDGFTDSFLGLCVLNVISPKIIVNEKGEYDQESMKVLQEFLKKFTLSARKNSADYEILRDVEVLMLRRIALLLSEPK